MCKANEAEPRSSHGDQFLIERQPAKGGDRGDQPGDGKRQDEPRGKQHGNHFEDGPDPDSFGHEQFDETQEFSRQHHKTERPEAEPEGSKKLGEDVAIE